MASASASASASSPSKCPYAHVLGVPGQGVHASRIFGLSINDILATIVLAAITSYFFKVSFLFILLFWFIVGELLHYLFGTQTAFLTMLGIKSCP